MRLSAKLSCDNDFYLHGNEKNNFISMASHYAPPSNRGLKQPGQLVRGWNPEILGGWEWVWDSRETLGRSDCLRSIIKSYNKRYK